MRSAPHNGIVTIKNVSVWTSDSSLTAQDVTIDKGITVSIAPTGSKSLPPNALIIDGNGLVLMPAGVDPQVHLRVPGQVEKETAATGLRAALAGGVGAILTMPNTRPVIDSVKVLNLAKTLVKDAEAETKVKVLFSAAITREQRGQECVPFEELAAAGVRAFTDDGVGVVSDECMSQAFAASAALNLPILQHAEYPGHRGVLAPGPVQEKLHIPAYTAAPEVDMIRRDLGLLKKYQKARYHVLHLSAAESVDLIEAAKREKLSVSCEVSPHHLLFCSSDIVESDASFKMNPPLRSKTDRDRLQQALADGVIDFVATDHAPHEPAVKGDNFKTAAFGTTGLECSLRVLLTLWQRRVLTSERLVEVFSTKPARFLGLSEDYGTIKEGLTLNAVLVDVKAAPSAVGDEDLFSLSKNCVFRHAPLAGKIHQVFLSGISTEV